MSDDPLSIRLAEWPFDMVSAHPRWWIPFALIWPFFCLAAWVLIFADLIRVTVTGKSR